MEYAYVATNNKGTKITGSVIAGSEEDAITSLISQKMDVIKIAAKRRDIVATLFSRKAGHLKAEELVTILLNVGELDKINMPMANIASILKDDIATGKNMKIFCNKLSVAIESGSTLADAFEQQPEAVDPLYASLVRIAENSGSYYETFLQIIDYIRWADNIRKNIKAVLIRSFASILFIVVLIIAISMLVMPKTVTFLKDNEMTVPWYTQLMIDMSNFVVHKYYFVLAGIFGFFVFLGLIMRVFSGLKWAIDRLKLRLPMLGTLIINIETARFITFFTIMYHAGVRIDVILGKTEYIIKNLQMRHRIDQMRLMIINGTSPQEAMTEANVFPIHVMKMMSIGFESGNIQNVMSNIKYFLDRDIKDRVDNLTAAIKPAFMILIGIMVAWMAIAVFGPIYSNLAKLADAGQSSDVSQQVNE